MIFYTFVIYFLEISAKKIIQHSNNHQTISNDFHRFSIPNSTPVSSNCNSPFEGSQRSSVTLQISNLDTTIEENELKQYLINRLKPITTVLSIYFESLSVAKIVLPSDIQARQVIAYLHRKKIGHKRLTVSYTRESSTLDSSTLRCQVAGLLKVSRFSTTIGGFSHSFRFFTFVFARTILQHFLC